MSEIIGGITYYNLTDLDIATVPNDLTEIEKEELPYPFSGFTGTLINGAYFVDVDNIGSGTGNYDTFLALSEDPNDQPKNSNFYEIGFNSNDTNPLNETNDEIDVAKTEVIDTNLLSTVTLGGVEYVEFRFDLNEENNAGSPKISLDAFKLYIHNESTIEGVEGLLDMNLVYNMDAGGDKSLLLSEKSTGSGTDDYAIYIPKSLIPDNKFLYVYVEMGKVGGDYAAGGGFDEFSFRTVVGEPENPDFTITKLASVADGTANKAGDVISYTVTVTNTGNITLTNMSLSDVLENYTARTASFNLAVGESRDFSYQHVLTQEELNNRGGGDGELDNIATASFGEMFKTADASVNLEFNPDFTITKLASVQSVDKAGDVISYTIAVANTGNIDLTNFAFTDSLVNSGIMKSGDLDYDEVLDVDEVWSFTYNYTVTQMDMDNGGMIHNIATASFGEMVKTADASVNLEFNPDFTITKLASVQSVDKAGDVITYTVTVTNTGNITLTNMSLSDVLENYASTEIGEGSFDLDVDDSRVFSYKHVLTQDELNNRGGGDGELDNIATASFGEMFKTADASVNLEFNPDFTITKLASVQSVDKAGDVISYTIAVANTGNIDLTNFAFTDSLVNSGIMKSGDLDYDAVLDVDEVWSFTYNYTVTQMDMDNGGMIHNVATIKFLETEDDDASADVEVVQKPSIFVTKLADVQSIEAITGNIIHYTIMVENTGNVSLNEVFAQDLNADDNQAAYYSGDLDYDAVLDVDETWVFKATHTLTDAEVTGNGSDSWGIIDWDGDIDNTVQVTAEVVNSDHEVSGDASAVVVLDAPGFNPRTPGFWSNWSQDWNGILTDDSKQAGPGDHDASPGFYEHDVLTLLYTGSDDQLPAAPGVQVKDPQGGMAKIGLLIGDWNTNGITDAGESTIFLDLSEARQILAASTKEQQDVQFTLARDLTANWLNFLADARVESQSIDILDIKDVMNESIDWLKNQTQGNIGNPIDNTITKASSSAWNNGIDTLDSGTSIGDHTTDIASGNLLHKVLDNYNNGIQYFTINPSSFLGDTLERFIVPDPHSL